MERLNAAGKLIYGKVSPRIGAVLRQPELAGSLRKIAEGGADVFYRGELAEAIADFVQSLGGLLSRDDLAGYVAEWQTPVSTSYRGTEVPHT